MAGSPNSATTAVPTRPAMATPGRRAAAIPARNSCRGRRPSPDRGRGRRPRPGRGRRPRPAEAEAAAHAEAARAEAAASAEMTVRPVIGDQLRMPIMWCEMGSCISWHADPAALGEADTRARAIGAGWRIDALGRRPAPGASRPTPASGPPARSCRGTGTPPSPGPRGPPCTATAPPLPGEAAVTPAALPAAISASGRRSRDGTGEHLRFCGGGPEGGPRLAPVSVSHRG